MCLDGGCEWAYYFTYDILVYGSVCVVVSAKKKDKSRDIFLLLNLRGTLTGGNYFY